MSATILAIDPGKTGGIAIVRADGSADALKMPATDRDILDLIREYAKEADRALIERVASSKQMGVVSAFNFGGNYRSLLMALTAVGIPFELVTPAKWQRSLGLPRGAKNLGGSSTVKKNAHKARAQELFPSLKITHRIADALLIGYYGRKAVV